jgi:hypothetical protein
MMKKIIAVVFLVAGLAGYFAVSAAVDAVSTIVSGADVNAFVASHWPAWLFLALASFAAWGVIGFDGALGFLRGGKGGPLPIRAPFALKMFGLANVLLLVAAAILRFA